MATIRKSFIICFGFEMTLMAILILGVILRLLGVATPVLSPWVLSFFFFPITVGYGYYFGESIAREIKRISPETYNHLFGDYFQNHFKYVAFVYGTDKSNPELNEIRIYAKRVYLLIFSFFLKTPLWVIVYS